MNLRQPQVSDIPRMIRLCNDTIGKVCSRDYSQAQIEVWQQAVSNIERWTEVIHNQLFYISEIESEIGGFASLANNNYIDFLYVHNKYQRCGIASILYAELEKKAILKGSSELISDVSISAVPFFEKKGFSILHRNTKYLQGVEIRNFRMEKRLDG